jgi:hypothetical protein
MAPLKKFVTKARLCKSSQGMDYNNNPYKRLNWRPEKRI